MEEDTGKTTHIGGGGRIHDADHSLVDYNRAGVPLVEIVSAPDIRSAAQARLYAAGAPGHPGGHRGLGRPHGGRLHAGRRQRVGATIGADEFGTRCEIKNLNSLRSLVRADRVRDRPAGGVARIGEQRRAADPALGRGPGGGPWRCAPRKRPSTTATSPSRIWCRVDPDAAWQAEVAAAVGPMPADRRAALAALLGARGDAEARSRPDRHRGRARSRRPHGGGRRGGVGAGSLALARTANEASADPEAGPRARPGSFTALLRMEQDGELSATQAKDGPGRPAGERR